MNVLPHRRRKPRPARPSLNDLAYRALDGVDATRELAAARRERDRVADEAMRALAILDPYTADPWSYQPGAVPRDAEAVREAAEILRGTLSAVEVSAAEMLSRARMVVARALALGVDGDVLACELAEVLGVARQRRSGAGEAA